MNDKQFTTFFLGVMGILLVIFFTIFFIAQIVAPETKKTDSFTTNAVISRIEPVGKLNYSDTEILEVHSKSELVKTDLYSTGEEVYNAVCQSCHAQGVMNSPKYADKAAWQKRLSKGKDKLYYNAINGIGAMPAKGGRPDLDDKYIEMSVDYIIQSVE
jgi:cytochrome c5